MTYDIIFYTHDYMIDRRQVTARTPKAAARKADNFPRLTFCTGYKVVRNGQIFGVRKFEV